MGYGNPHQTPPGTKSGPRAIVEGENEAGYSAGARRDPGNANGWAYASNISNNQDAEYDPDLYRASILQRYLAGEGGLQNQVKSYAGDMNTDVAKSAMANLLARAGQRREMKGQLSGLGGQLKNEEDLLTKEANYAVDRGVKNTRTNFNQRGLLYGGMREGGEESVKAEGAATLSSNLAGARRDTANQGDALKKAIAQLGLQSQQESIERANAVMETSMRNSVARQQAYQQLGQGVGMAAGMAYGGGAKKPGSSAAVAPNDYTYMGTGSSDGFGGTQLPANNDPFYGTGPRGGPTGQFDPRWTA